MSSTPVTYATTFRISELFWDKLRIKPVVGLNILPNVHAFMALKDWKSYLLSSTTLLELHKTIYILLIQTVTSIMISILINSKMYSTILHWFILRIQSCPSTQIQVILPKAIGKKLSRCSSAPSLVALKQETISLSIFLHQSVASLWP